MIRVQFTIDGFAALSRRDIAAAMRQVMHAIGLKWRADMLPGHFEKRAHRLYREYQPRKGDAGSGRKFKGSYVARKIKKKGHNKPLDYSGDSKREATSSKRVIARATSEKASCRIPLPVGLNRRHPKSRVNMRQEIEAVNQGELTSLGKFGGGRLEKRLGSPATVRLTQEI